MRAAAFVAFCVLAATSASAQSLADVARQEGERRQAVSAAAKSYSNKDLKPTKTVDVVDSPTAASDSGAAPASATEPAADAADTSKDGAASADAAQDAKDDTSDSKKADTKDEKYWSKRMAELRDQLERDQTFLQALQGRVDSLTTDFVNRDDPAQRGQIANDRQKALAELERLRKAVEADKRAIPELEDEARRSGVPAGWLR
ncbi:MAG: hypothetical protein U0Q11_06640 [Vicinamibacterales bacterium]